MQATGLKGEVGAEQAAKRPKVGIVGDAAKAATPRCTDPGIAVGSPQTEITMDKNKSAENVVPYSSKTNSAMVLLEPTVLKQSVRPLALGGTPSQMNRYKLDNRPMGFRIMAPLPTGLANVSLPRSLSPSPSPLLSSLSSCINIPNLFPFPPPAPPHLCHEKAHNSSLPPLPLFFHFFFFWACLP